MRRNYFVALTLFAGILLCALVQLSAELTPLQQAEKDLETADGQLGNANTHLTPPHTVMWAVYNQWLDNEEDINYDNLLATSTARDPAALAALGLIHAKDISDKLRLSSELAGAISNFNTHQDAVNKADRNLQTAWGTYIELAKHLSPGERYVIKNTALQLSPVSVSLPCPGCGKTYSGENLGSIGEHVNSCSENGHAVDSLPYFNCTGSGCPKPEEHHTFACRGGCGELFPQPTIVSPPAATQGAGNFTTIYHDHGYDCEVDVSGIGNCPKTAYTCKTPECPNDAKHLIDGECGDHKVEKGDASALAAHKSVGQSCPETYTYPSGRVISCLIYIGYKCDEHSIHDYDPGPGTNPPPEVLDNTPNCDYCTDGCSSCTPKVVCPADAWTNCGGTKSHATTCGVGHSYYTCNPAAVQAHDWHTGCPADSWTNCGGLTSHKKKCGRGHWYYTCNPAAVQAHSWH